MARSRSLPQAACKTAPVVRCRWATLPAVYRVHRACFPHPYPFSRFLGYQFAWTSRILINAPGEPRGYLIATLTPRDFPPRPVGEIISLGVLAEDRRQGHGEALLKHAVDWLWSKPIDRILLQVAVDNSGAQALYERVGFQRLERLPAYYITGEDAYLMGMERE